MRKLEFWTQELRAGQVQYSILLIKRRTHHLLTGKGKSQELEQESEEEEYPDKYGDSLWGFTGQLVWWER